MGVYLEKLGVDLKLGYGASLLLGGLSARLDALEEVVDGAGDDTQLLIPDVDVKPRPHGVGLPRTSLDGEEKTLNTSKFLKCCHSSRGRLKTTSLKCALTDLCRLLLISA